MSKANALHAKISGVLEEFKIKCLSSMDEFSDASELRDHVLQLNDMLSDEKTYYEVSINTSIIVLNCYDPFFMNNVLYAPGALANQVHFLKWYYLFSLKNIS